MTIRRLAAILAANMVGVSATMEKDEEGTLEYFITQVARQLAEPPYTSRRMSRL
jgi:class 3 adenylate cyclase